MIGISQCSYHRDLIDPGVFFVFTQNKFQQKYKFDLTMPINETDSTCQFAFKIHVS